MSEYGTLGKLYHLERKTRKSLKYRLKRRTDEVIASIKKYYSGIPDDIIDLGAADGLMLSMVKDIFSDARCIGVEYTQELVEANKDDRITLLQGDVNSLEMPDNSFDIVIATAIIEHIPVPEKMLKEARRILRPNGLMILTSPDPFWERIATMVGHLHDEQHHKVMNLKEIASLMKEVGFLIIEKKKFMLSPVGIPLECLIENTVRSMGLNFLFANQLVVGKTMMKN